MIKTNFSTEEFPAIMLLADELYKVLSHEDAKNFVTMTLTDKGNPAVIVTVQRPDGETPAEQLQRITDEKETLRAKLSESEQRVNALEDALCAIADGRGMVPDKSTIYMNGRTPEIPATFNKHDMQEIAKRALEATCQK